MLISLIAAMSQNRVIGIDNQLPWKLPADLRHFRSISMGKPILMGRRTFESIGKPLPGRINIIVSRNPAFRVQGGIVVSTISEGIRAAEEHEELMVIGGASIYSAILPLTNRMYLTLIHQDFAGDAYFTNFDESEWAETERQDCPVDEFNPYAYSFITLQRKRME